MNVLKVVFCLLLAGSVVAPYSAFAASSGSSNGAITTSSRVKPKCSTDQVARKVGKNWTCSQIAHPARKP